MVQGSTCPSAVFWFYFYFIFVEQVDPTGVLVLHFRALCNIRQSVENAASAKMWNQQDGESGAVPITGESSSGEQSGGVCCMVADQDEGSRK